MTRIACALRHYLWRLMCAVGRPDGDRAGDHGRAAAGALPVRRTDGGTYAALLAAAKPALAQRRTVVIYPRRDPHHERHHRRISIPARFIWHATAMSRFSPTRLEAGTR
jgi:hypothetical protein